MVVYKRVHWTGAGIWKVDQEIICKHLQFSKTSSCCLGHMFVTWVLKRESFHNIFIEIIGTVCMLLEDYGYCSHVHVYLVLQYGVVTGLCHHYTLCTYIMVHVATL